MSNPVIPLFMKNNTHPVPPMSIRLLSDIKYDEKTKFKGVKEPDFINSKMREKSENAWKNKE